MGRNNSIIPEAINNFNVYKAGNRLIGVTEEVSLAEIKMMTDTIKGAGLLGEYNTPLIGQYQSIQQEIPFRMLEDDIFSMANPMKIQELTLRASEQYMEKKTLDLGLKGLKIVMRGRTLEFKPGSVKNGGQMGASVTMEVFYLKIVSGGKDKFELDKLNGVLKIDGKDVMKDINKYC